MKCNIIVNAWDPYILDHCRRIAGLIEDIKHLGKVNMIILGDEDSEKNWGTLTESVPADSVFCLVTSIYRPETGMKTLESFIKEAELNIFPNNLFGDEAATRLAIKTGGSALTGVTELLLGSEKLKACKKVYSGHIMGTFVLQNPPYCVSVDKSCIESDKCYKAKTPERIIRMDTEDILKKEARIVEPVKAKSGLAGAEFVIAFGRGVGSKENTLIAKQLAHDLGASFGCTRPVAMNAWAPMENLIGVSGNIIAPKICIVAGLSGAPAFYAGIERSKYIVAINSDERAPIMKKADLAIHGDWENVLEALVVIHKGDSNG